MVQLRAAVRISGVAEAVNMIMAASGEMRRTQLRELVHALNRPRTPPPSPAIVRGPFQYVDIDFEATQVLYCPKPIARDGSYTKDPGRDWVLNAATGGSDFTRGKGLQGDLRWDAGRNLQLPTVVPGFCLADDGCPQLEPLAGDRKLLLDDTGRPALGKMFIGDDPRGSERLLSNRLLFDSVRKVPTHFELTKRYALLLRYVARWSVAHRVWQLCDRHPELVAKLRAGYERVCVDHLPLRPIDDRIGSGVYWEAIY